MRKDELKKRSKGVAFVIALLVLTTSLSQCHNEPGEELLEKIDNSDNLGNGRHDMNDGSLDASKNNEHEHTHDFSVEESTEETSIEDVAHEASSEASTSDNVNSNKKDNKKEDKGKEDSSSAATTLASIINNIINPSKSDDNSNNNQTDNSSSNEGENDNSSAGSGNDNSNDNKDDNKGWHIHIWGAWTDNGSNEIRTCILDKTHTQTRDHKYGSPVYDATLNKDVYTCTQCGHKDQREHTHHYGATQEEVVGTAETCCKTYHVCSDCNHKEYIGTVSHTYGNFAYNPQTGKDEATCSKCNHKNQREHTHHWEAWIDNGNNEIRRCNDDNSHTETRNHSYGPYIYDPSTGKDVATCSNCGHKTSKNHEHHYGQWQDNGSNEKRVCSDDSSHIETRSHTMGEYAYNSSTGLEESHCSTCSHVDTRAHSHHYGSDTEEIVGEAGVCYKTYHVCSDCSNKEYTSTVTTHTMGGYTYNPSTGLEESTCSKCGYVATQAHTNHHWESKTEEVQGDGTVCYKTYNECSDCHTKVDVQDHYHGFGDWQDNGDNEIRHCTHNSAHTETQEHSWSVEVVGTTKTSTCSSCGAVRTETVECQHDWQYREKSITPTADYCWVKYEECTICHATRNEEYQPHSWHEVDDGSGQEDSTYWECSRCHTERDTLGARRERSPLDIYLDILNDKKMMLASLRNQIDLYYYDADKYKVLKKEKKERV
ncbi:MAG: hypothetical protein E7159_02630 [Firmicutes bacterium]|jgi:hypothetical protein|nr:hypothetical protein [Bacillota bacterium]